jgi:ABC-2 type transport system ATP-binding protein
MADGAGPRGAPPPPLIAIAGLGKRYGRHVAIADLSLVLREGEIVGLVGPNGSGKTTALRLLAGLLRPDEGGGTVLGFDLRLEAAEIRAQVGYLAQRLSLYAELSVVENLRFRADVYGLADARAAAEAAAATFDLTRHRRRRAGSLSGGWARRLQLAAALVHAPRLVLLDEPTSGLDADSRDDLWCRIFALAAAGAGVVVATHDPAETARCSRLVALPEWHVVLPAAP